MEEINFKLYDIKKCGYYKNRSKKVEYGMLPETLDQMHEWCIDKPLRLRTTFEPPQDSDILKAYIVDMKKAVSGNVYFTIWNQVPSSDKNVVAALDGKSSIDKLKIRFRDFGNDYIPGFATYFWVILKDNILSTIRFNKSYNGHPKFKYLIRGFLENNPNYTHMKKDIDTGTIIITGYDTKDKKLAFPKFETYSRKKSGPIKYLKKNINLVKAIHGRPILYDGDSEDLSVYNKLLGLLGVSIEKQLYEANTKIEYKIPCSLTSSDFNEIYKEWKEVNGENSDVGFSIGKEIIWLSHEIQKTSKNFEVRKLNNEVFDLDNIMNIIEDNKEVILNECSKENK